jgi:hypothetical protein
LFAKGSVTVAFVPSSNPGSVTPYPTLPLLLLEGRHATDIGYGGGTVEPVDAASNDPLIGE